MVGPNEIHISFEQNFDRHGVIVSYPITKDDWQHALNILEIIIRRNNGELIETPISEDR